jgi:hypothetical protein
MTCIVKNLATTNVAVGIVASLALSVGGCASDSYAARGAAGGAKSGAVAGAVGGLVTSLVFGGDPLDAAARGAVYGGAVGATAGGMAGAEQDKAVAAQREAELERLKQQIGPDAFEGLAALAECRHAEALAMAGKARQSENKDYSLAGLWLAVLTYGDSRCETEARGLFPDLISLDPDVRDAAEAEETMRKGLTRLMDIREEYKLPRVCGI